MSSIHFAKYSGLGNDFILFEKTTFLESTQGANFPEWIASLCHRRRSIGADGVILYEKLDDNQFSLDFYNSDGSFASLCGNGLRCAAHYLAKKTNRNKVQIQTKFFLHECEIEGNRVTCTMQTPKYLGGFPFLENREWHLLECGVPHLIHILNNTTPIETLPLEKIGHALQRKKELPFETVNVSFLQPREEKVLIRTYERGVFLETECCGTAAMCAASLLRKIFPSEASWVFQFAGFSIKEEEAFIVELDPICKMQAKVEHVFDGILHLDIKTKVLKVLQTT